MTTVRDPNSIAEDVRVVELGEQGEIVDVGDQDGDWWRSG